MKPDNRYLLFPKEILKVGFLLLAGCSVVASLSLWFFSKNRESARLTQRVDQGESQKALLFSIDEEENIIPLPLPRVELELEFFRTPSRPGSDVKGHAQCVVKLKRSSELKKIELPCRLDLQYGVNQILYFSPQKSTFWLDLSESANGRVLGTLQAEGSLETVSFTKEMRDIPIRTAKEFEEKTPFRILADAIWNGWNLIAEKYEGKKRFRLLIQDKLVEVEEGGWFFWQEGSWKNGEVPMALPLDAQAARIAFVDSKQMILEGWDGADSVRISLTLTPSTPLNLRPEEMLSALRVRSEKQMSCMLDKQCFILRAGEWVLKNNGKWKVLRTQEEKESFREGKLLGELFVFEKIEVKQGQKWVQGVLFSKERTEAVPIQMAVNQSPLRKGKGQSP